MDPHPGLEAYRNGTELLRRGLPEEAARALEEIPAGTRSAAHRLALGKALLEVGRWGEALAALEPLTTRPPRDPGSRAYLELLVAAALAGAGRTSEALRRLDDVAGLDARLERASRALARRTAEGQEPLVRL